MIKWKGYHSLEERENYLLYRLESLEEEVEKLKPKQARKDNESSDLFRN